jgi:pimeloyl-ACP methyl ester carboxylesterase
MSEAGFEAPEFQALSVSTADGARLHVRHGQATGRPAFLLVHGVASNARMWDEVAGRLNAENHPTYAVDLRGHGESDGFDTYDTATAARDVAAVAAAFGLTDAVVAGHSWGASISLRIAAEHPKVAAGLALIDGGWADAAQAAGWTGEEGRDERLSRWLDALALRFVKRESMAPAELRAHLLVPRLTGPQFASIVTSVWDEQPHRWFPAVTVPVMLLPVAHRYSPVGERQWREWVNGAAAALSDATVRWYLDADHDVQYEQPERLAQDLLDLVV